MTAIVSAYAVEIGLTIAPALKMGGVIPNFF
jgi:hypothetical protein